MITATARPNKFAGKCAGCQGAVLANEGQLTGSTGSWTVRHLPGECSTAAPAPVKTGPEVKTMGVFRAPAGGLWVARPSRGPDKTRLVAFALVPGSAIGQGIFAYPLDSGQQVWSTERVG